MTRPARRKGALPLLAVVLGIGSLAVPRTGVADDLPPLPDPPPLPIDLAASSTEQIDAAHTGQQIGVFAPPLEQAWTWSHVEHTPLVALGRAFVYDGDGASAVDTRTGARVWGPISDTTPLAYDAARVFAQFPGGLRALDALSGLTLWERPVVMSSLPVGLDGTLYLIGDSHALAVDEVTGATRWQADLPYAGDAAAPAVAGGRVFFAGTCATIALDARTGTTDWTQSAGCIGGGSPRVPVVHDGRVYVTGGGTCLVLDETTGSVVGAVNSRLPPAFGPALGVLPAAEQDFVGAGSYPVGELRGVDDLTGTVRWQTQRPWAPFDSSPVVVNGFAYVVDELGSLGAYDLLTGTEVWTRWVGRTSAGLSAGPDVLLVPTYDQLLAFRALPLSVGALLPAAGPSNLSTTVAVNGSGFAGTTEVRVGGEPALDFAVASDFQLVALFPALPPGRYEVEVVTPTGVSTPSDASGFLVAGAPSVSSISPPIGPPAGGTVVHIVGSGLSATSGVRFGAVPAARFAVLSDELVEAVAPPGSGPVDVVVASPAGDALAGSFASLAIGGSPHPSTTVQVNAAHTGEQPGALSAPLVRLWSRDLENETPSYPVIADGKVFTVVGSLLYAFDARTGVDAWGPVDVGSVGQPAYDNGTVIVSTTAGPVQAFDARTGTRLWSTPWAIAALGAPVPSDGVVYAAGGGGVAALSARDGHLLWLADADGSPEGTPAVGPGGIVSAGVCGAASAFTSSGSLRWHLTSACTGGAGTMPALHGTGVYARDLSLLNNPCRDVVLDSASGSAAGCFDDAAVAPVAFSGSTLVTPRATGPYGTPVELRATDISSGVARWSFAGDGLLQGPAVTENAIVYAASGGGHLYGLDAGTGAVRWAEDLGAPALTTGMAIGDGILAVPTTDGLAVYGSSLAVDTVTPAVIRAIASGPVTITGHGFTGATQVSFGRAPATSVTVLSDTEIVAATPLLAPGGVDVVVAGPMGESPVGGAGRVEAVTSVPGAPGAPVASAGDHAAQVTWGLIPGLALDPLATYTVTAAPGGSKATVPSTAGVALVTGLANGVRYTFTVVAATAAGVGPASQPSAPVLTHRPITWLGPFDTPEAMVAQQYLDFLGRPADAGGLAYWASLVRGGALAPHQVAGRFLASPEFGARAASLCRLYLAFFRRQPDAGGLYAWLAAMSRGWSLRQIADAFATSPEFLATYGALSDTDFVTRAYLNVLGRLPDPAGLAYWRDQLSNHALSRGGLMIGMSESSEFRAATATTVAVATTYLAMLRRAADPGGLAYWAGVVRQTGSVDSLVAGVLFSPEYAARFG